MNETAIFTELHSLIAFILYNIITVFEIENFAYMWYTVEIQNASKVLSTTRKPHTWNGFSELLFVEALPLEIEENFVI